MSLRGIKLVTFDATNTLLKFRVPPWQHYAAVAQDHGFRGTGDDIKQRLLSSYKVMWNRYPNFGKSKITWNQWWEQVVRSTFEGQLPENVDVELIAKQLIEEFTTSKCWLAAEGGPKLIELLCDNGLSIGVISNFDPRLNNILNNVKLNNFDFVLTSYEIGYIKPDKRIFKHAIDKWGKDLQPSECLHIGDDVEKDYEGARGAGWHAVLVSSHLQSEIPPAPEHVFKSLDDLSVAIRNRKLKL